MSTQSTEGSDDRYARNRTPTTQLLTHLVELSSAALCLYSALGVFRDKDDPPKAHEWFRAPRLHHRVRRFAGLSKEEIDQGLEELMKAELVQVRF